MQEDVQQTYDGTSFIFLALAQIALPSYSISIDVIVCHELLARAAAKSWSLLFLAMFRYMQMNTLKLQRNKSLFATSVRVLHLDKSIAWEDLHFHAGMFAVVSS